MQILTMLCSLQKCNWLFGHNVMMKHEECDVGMQAIVVALTKLCINHQSDVQFNKKKRKMGIRR